MSIHSIETFGDCIHKRGIHFSKTPLLDGESADPWDGFDYGNGRAFRTNQKGHCLDSLDFNKEYSGGIRRCYVVF